MQTCTDLHVCSCTSSCIHVHALSLAVYESVKDLQSKVIVGHMCVCVWCHSLHLHQHGKVMPNIRGGKFAALLMMWCASTNCSMVKQICFRAKHTH